jgi:hypothetical protein
MFDSSQQLMDTISLDAIRKSIQAHDYQIDLICKYMTKLEDAIDIKKDSVLSSDNFTKEFINVVSDKSSKIFIDTFNDKATNIKDKYDVQELFEDMYYKTSKYGEYFLYQVPYHRAFKRLIERKHRFGQGIHYESGDVLYEASNCSFKDSGITNESMFKEMSEKIMAMQHFDVLHMEHTDRNTNKKLEEGIIFSSKRLACKEAMNYRRTYKDFSMKFLEVGEKPKREKQMSAFEFATSAL